VVPWEPVNRYDFQRLARIRLEEAKILLRNARFEGCYYLSGYVVECGLKACIAKLTKRYDFPDKGIVQGAYTHDLTRLLETARLEAARDKELERDREFRLNWLVVKEWREQSRYEVPGGQQAKDLFNAVADRKHGVLRWIRQHW
jgi:HEPN domain-containing protein